MLTYLFSSTLTFFFKFANPLLLVNVVCLEIVGLDINNVTRTHWKTNLERRMDRDCFPTYIIVRSEVDYIIYFQKEEMYRNEIYLRY